MIIMCPWYPMVLCLHHKTPKKNDGTSRHWSHSLTATCCKHQDLGSCDLVLFFVPSVNFFIF